MAFEQPPLPFPVDALEPHISARTIQVHYGKHHKAYVEKLNELTRGTPFAEIKLEDVIRQTADKKEHKKIFNNAAQAWNHEFFWCCLRPSGSDAPIGELAKKIKHDFGGKANLIKAFDEAGKNRFGSGWLWLLAEDGELKVAHTPNAKVPWLGGANALLTIDVWEHAYYLDYQNDRSKFVTTLADELLNWEFAAKNYTEAVVHV